jgi:hypothetical protein
VPFASFLSGGFTVMAVINPPVRKPAKRTSVHCREMANDLTVAFTINSVTSLLDHSRPFHRNPIFSFKKTGAFVTLKK